MNLKVPYNFVPLNKKVVSPYWIDHISHDMPFKDGRSGTLELTLKAESPIFVKQGTEKEEGADQITEAQTEPYKFEQDPEGNYFIPGSSVRGMVRSVLETLSFGRMIGRVGERRYALRDLKLRDEYLSHFAAGTGKKATRAGWLGKDEITGQYVIYDCGVPGRISHQQINNNLQLNVREMYDNRHAPEFKDISDTDAVWKYLYADKINQGGKLARIHEFIFDGEGATQGDRYDKRQIYKFAQGNPAQGPIRKGQIILTGQPSPRKDHEFIFFNDKKPIKIPVPKVIFNNFKMAYDGDKPEVQQPTDYKWRIKQLEGGQKIPVFFSAEDVETALPRLKHFGLSYLYKLPYKLSIEESIKNFQDNPNAADLADAIFGTIGDEKTSTASSYLKGRIQISHAKTEGEVELGEVQEVILGEPRASFYPTYIDQNAPANGSISKYKTFMKTDAKIAGRKRYPVINGDTRATRSTDDNGDALSPKVFTKFTPLRPGTRFECSVYYHNLCEIELGALLSAFTFHGTEAARHQIGMAKPLGFGRIKLEVAGMNMEEQIRLMLKFEAYMESEIAESQAWRESAQIRELISMATPVNRQDVEVLDGNYPYNSLGEFRKVKANKEALPRHSKMRTSAAEISLPVTLSDGMVDEILEHKKSFPAGVKSLENIKVDIEDKVKNRLNAGIEKLKAHKRTIIRAAEKAKTDAIEKRRQKERTAREEFAQIARNEQAHQNALKALDDGPEYANLFMGRPREYWKNLASIISEYLEIITPAHQPSPEDGQIPKQWQDGLKEKALEVGQKMPSKDWKKKMSEKQADVDAWFGKSNKFNL